MLLSNAMSTPNLDAELLVYNLESFPGEIRNWAPYMEDKMRPKKEAGHSRIVGGSSISKRTYIQG